LQKKWLPKSLLRKRIRYPRISRDPLSPRPYVLGDYSCSSRSMSSPDL
jgi:hypothetical protein